MKIVDQFKLDARFLKVDYVGHEKFKVSSRDGMK